MPFGTLYFLPFLGVFFALGGGFTYSKWRVVHLGSWSVGRLFKRSFASSF